MLGDAAKWAWGTAHLEPIPARAEAARLKALLAKGTDPIELKRTEKAEAARVQTEDKVELQMQAATFKVAAERYIKAQEAGWRNLKHRQQWENTLKTYAYPTIGDMPVRDIKAQHVIEILEPIWSVKPETC